MPSPMSMKPWAGCVNTDHRPAKKQPAAATAPAMRVAKTKILPQAFAFLSFSAVTPLMMPNGLRLSCGLRRPQTRQRCSSPNDRCGPTVSCACKVPASYQVDGLVMVPWASLSVGGSWEAANVAERICFTKEASRASTLLAFA